MPLYDFYCEFCKVLHVDERIGRLTDKEGIYCANCENKVQMQLTKPGRTYDFNVGLYPELMGPENRKPITTKAELRREAKNHGKYSEYASA